MQSASGDGLFNLLDDNLFCQALCCGPCLFGSNEMWFKQNETMFAGKEEQAAVFWLAFSPLGFLTNWMCVSAWHQRQRRKLAELKKSDESNCESCFYAACCSVCSIAQINREMSVLRRAKAGSGKIKQQIITQQTNDDGSSTTVTSAPTDVEMLPSVAGVLQHTWRTVDTARLPPQRARNAAIHL